MADSTPAAAAPETPVKARGLEGVSRPADVGGVVFRRGPDRVDGKHVGHRAVAKGGVGGGDARRGAPEVPDRRERAGGRRAGAVDGEPSFRSGCDGNGRRYASAGH